MAKFDKNLIFLISENVRLKLKDASVLLKKSSQRLRYSIDTMEKELFLHSPHTIIDYSYLGQILFRVYFKGGYASEKDKNQILKKLLDNPHITSIYELSGEFDLVVEIQAANPSKFNKELTKIANEFPTLNNYKMILNVVSYILPRYYLTKNTTVGNNCTPSIIVGGDRANEQFSDRELSVIKYLVQNPKTRLSTLAKNSKLNVRTASNIIEDLKKRKILLGQKYIISADKLSVYRVRLLLKLHNLTENRQKYLLNFLKQTNEVIQINKTLGDWSMEVDLESLNRTKTRQTIIQLRTNFKDIIESFNSTEFYHYFKKGFVAEYLFENLQ